MNRRRIFFFANRDRDNPKCRLSVPANQPIHYSGQIHDVSRILYASFKDAEAHGTIEAPFAAPGSSVSTNQMIIV